MKICFITHDMHLNTGIGAVSRNLVEGVAKRHPDWDVDVVVEEASGHALETETIQTGKLELFKTTLRLRRVLRKYDIIHAIDGFPYGFVTIVSTLWLGKKIFITAIGSGSLVMLVKPVFGFFIKLSYKKADEFFAISRYTSSKIQEYVHDLPVTVINLGTDAMPETSSDEDKQLLPHVEDKKPYMLTVGSFKERKGQKQLVQGYIEAVKKVPKLKYVFIGKLGNDYVDEIQSMVGKAGLSSKVFFLEDVPLDLLQAIYKNATLFAMLPQEQIGSTDIEGFGLVFLEAAAAGIPVIASTEGPSEDAVAPHKNAILVEPHDVEAISRAIVDISTDRGLQEKMSRESYTFAKYMSWDRMVNAYMPFYEK